MHFPEYNTEYFKQLTGEQLVAKIVKGYPKREWQKTRDRNEALDCRVYARAASIAIGIDRWSESRWEQLIGNATEGYRPERPQQTENAAPIVNKSVVAPTRPRIIRSSML
jgi:phage terminase large subunit GpA-like protein